MAGPVQRVVLIGFMGSGKSTVGRVLADRLGWIHIDFDQVIERERRLTIAQIFEREGEAAFRALEAEVTRRVISSRDAVLTPGGGWVTNPELLSLVPDETLLAWLRVGPAEVVRRVQADPGAPRPLLEGADPARRISRLMEQREPLYRAAPVVIDVDGRHPASLAAELERLVRSNG